MNLGAASRQWPPEAQGKKKREKKKRTTEGRLERLLAGRLGPAPKLEDGFEGPGGLPRVEERGLRVTGIVHERPVDLIVSLNTYNEWHPQSISLF